MHPKTGVCIERNDTMPKKRKKYPKLPNGFGSIKYLGPGRSNPYAVHPPTTEFSLNGSPITPKALAYVDDWYWGFSILMAYKAGTFVPGEYPPKPSKAETKGLDTLVQSLLSDLSVIRQAVTGKVQETAPTFADVYEDFYKWKYEEDKSKVYSVSSRQSTRAAFKNCAALHDKIFKEIGLNELQEAVDSCGLKHSSMELIVTLFKQMYKYAEPRNLCEKNYASYVTIKVPDDDEHGIPFTDNELKILWNDKENEVTDFILIMCYSGYRISAYREIKINLNEQYFQGGVKTAAGKNRIVPIHSAILPLVERLLCRKGKLLSCKPNDFRIKMYERLEELKIKKHTPHDCRHTFSMLCENFNVNENDRKRMLGHSFGTDITNGIYGHRTVDDLRKEIEKIKVCY